MSQVQVDGRKVRVKELTRSSHNLLLLLQQDIIDTRTLSLVSLLSDLQYDTCGFLDLGRRVSIVDHETLPHSTPAQRIVMDHAPWTARSGQIDSANTMNSSWQKYKQYTVSVEQDAKSISLAAATSRT